jgi:hypothetical protein
MSFDRIAIRVSHLRKRYKLGGPLEPYHTFRDTVLNLFRVWLGLCHNATREEGLGF